jgi:predicted ATPase/DNA-binding CsgD family transcriptional regulator
METGTPLRTSQTGSVLSVISHRPPAHRLPPQPTRLIDREDELLHLSTLLTRETGRLLTLTGPGGVGKTRLAIAAAEQVREQFPGGVWFIDLTPLADAALVVPTIARQLGVREESEQDLAAALRTTLGESNGLLLLDNLEHLLPAAAALDTLLAMCPSLTILATSRSPLQLRREQVVEVHPLPVPSTQRSSWTVVSLETVPAIELFVDRAQAADADFALSIANVEAVAELSRRLDGLPLALELAAARTRLLAPDALLARVEHGLTLLRWDTLDLPPRHRTLRATLDWSYALLSPEEQAVFRRLGVFAGGFTYEAVAAVAARDQLAVEPLDIIAALVDKHLVRTLASSGEESRFGQLATVRDYALEQLEANTEVESTRDRHLAHYLALAEQADRAMLGPDEAAWLNRLDSEVDNLRQAHDWAIARGDLDAEWRLVAALALFWVLRGYLGEGLERSNAARSRAFDAGPVLRAHFLEGAGLLALWSGDDARAVADFEESLGAAKAAGETALAAHVLGHLGYAAYAQGNVARARALIAEMLALARAANSGLNIGYAFHWRVLIAIGPHGGPQERAQLRAELDEPVTLLREGGGHRDLAGLLAGQARLLIEVDAPAAFAALREALVLGRETGDPLMVSIVPWLALVVLAERLPVDQFARLSGGLAALQERSAAIGWRTTIDVFGAPQDRTVLEHAVSAGHVFLGEEAFTAAEATGRGLSRAAIIDEMLVALKDGEGGLAASAREASPFPFHSLISPREREVLALVATGHTNKAIAEALFVAPSTVKTHVTSLLTKLDAGNRAQLATIVAQREFISS